MTDLPDPLVPPDCDLRGYDFMPLFGQRLFGSSFYARATDAEFRAAMRLWWAAWQQCPAGSLPDDDHALALLADFGRDVRRFRKVREVALHGFVKCNDGRLYHPLLCNEAAEAYARRKKERMRKAEYRSREPGSFQEETPKSNGLARDVPRDKPGTSAGRDADGVGTGQDRTEEKKEKESPVPASVGLDPPRARARARLAPLPPDWLPSGEGVEHASALGLDLPAVLRKFVWRRRSLAQRSADWDADFALWCESEAEYLRRNPGRPRGDGMAQVVSEMMAARGFDLGPDDDGTLDRLLVGRNPRDAH